MPYSIYRDLTAGGGALIKKVSHWDVNLGTGAKLPDDFEVPVEFKIDLHTEGRRMPTLFVVPALLAKKPFYEILLKAGVDNVDAYPAIIRNTETGEQFTDYLFLNVVGRVGGADMGASDVKSLGPGVNLIDSIVFDRAKWPELHMFRLAEDRQKVLISDQVFTHLDAAKFDDVYYQPVVLR